MESLEVKLWIKLYNLVYKIEYQQCMSVYVGEKKRALKKRKEEHENNNIAVAVMNVYKKNYYHHDFQWENIKILDFECNWYKRIISEMLHIKSKKFSINKKEDVSSLSNIYSPIFKFLM